MQVKIHKQDMEDIMKLVPAKELVDEVACTGMLKRGDIQLSWKQDNAFLTIQGKDIKVK